MEKLSVITDEQAEAIKAQHAQTQLRLLRYVDADVIIRPAPSDIYQRFLDQISEKETRGVASRALVFGCVVHPPQAEFAAILKQKPGLIGPLSDECAQFSGAKAATEKKDL